MRLKLSTGAAKAINSAEPEAIEGGHADYLFFVFDEAKIIPDEMWDALEGTFAGGGESGPQYAKILAMSTPGEPNGRFFDIHRRKKGYEDWHIKHITKEQAISSGRMAEEWADNRKLQWGSESQLYYNHVLGEFKERDEDAIIPLHWIEQAFDRWDVWQAEIEKNGSARGELTSIGCDVGTGGSNDSGAIARCYDDVRIDTIDEVGHRKNITMVTAGMVKGILDAYQDVRAYIDVIGIGLGVFDRLREQNYDRALPFNSAEKAPPTLKDKTGEFKFANKRSAMWWLGREMLDPSNNCKVALPRDDKLIGELTTPKYEIMSNAVIKVESKKDIRKRIHRSTDYADAVLQALTGPRIVSRSPTRVYVAGEGYIR